MKILTVIGARPQFIKAAAVSRVIRKLPNVDEVLIHTGQHFDHNMSEIFFLEMDIPVPKYNLEISSLSHGAMTGRMLEGIEGIILNEKPDWVLVYGDTNSTLAGALAASKLCVPIAHVEAGLRSYNIAMPEEQNRVVTDRLSNLLFCPTITATENLHREGYANLSSEIICCGDVMYDAALFYQKRATRPTWFHQVGVLNGFALATVHRAENTDDPRRLAEIILALNEINNSTPVILPLHPRTRKKIDAIGLNIEVNIVQPLGYLEMLYLLKNSNFVISDSGGVQKESYFFGKRCFVLRDETEWTELVEHGFNVLVGANFKQIVDTILNPPIVTNADKELYGDGTASEKIVSHMFGR